MSQVPPRDYLFLIRYTQSKQTTVALATLIYTIGLILVIIITRKLLDDLINQVVIIGTGKYPGILSHLLRKRGYRVATILPSRDSILGLSFNRCQWWRSSEINRYIPYHTLFGFEEEISQIDRCLRQAIDDQLVPSMIDLDKFESTTDHTCGMIETITSQKIGERTIEQITLSNQTVIRGEYVIIVETNDYHLLNRYLDLDHPYIDSEDDLKINLLVKPKPHPRIGTIDSLTLGSECNLIATILNL